MRLQRGNGVPYYIQLKEQIKDNIVNGVWKAGTRLPTERELAQELGVSRNTVSQAYAGLEAEGILSSAQGRGTFVADVGLAVRQEGRKDKVLRIIDRAMEEAVGLGFSIDDFVSFVHVRGMEKKEFLSRVKVGFVECNPEQLADLPWNLGPGVSIVPILLGGQNERNRLREALRTMDMVVTGVSHLTELRPLVEPLQLPLLGVSWSPPVETLIRVARLPVHERVALVCESQEFAGKVQEILTGVGLTTKLEIVLKPEEEVLQQVFGRCAAVLVTPGLRSLVDRLLPDNMERIVFRFEPDAGSLNLLRSALLDLKTKTV